VNIVLFIYSEKSPKYKIDFLKILSEDLNKLDFEIMVSDKFQNSINLIKSNPRICCVILDWEHYHLDSFNQFANFNPHLPIFAVSDIHQDIELKLKNFKLNLDFIQYDSVLLHDDVQRVINDIEKYHQHIIPPFTKNLMEYVKKNNYSFCTPGHQQGDGFQKTPTGALFYDFYGPNIFKSDISISMAEMGSLLEHSGPHKDAEEFIAKTFNADRSLIVINGTSTSNKIVGMYAIADGDTVLIDRNCHKSLAHLLMMTNANPIYLKPTRNAHGILGGIPKQEFTKNSIQEKLDNHPVAKSWPTYAVVTNSTYDGIFYNVEYIKKELNVNTLHFDSAWVPYTNAHPIYKNKYGMCNKPKNGQTIFETQSTHKLLAAFSQTSMIHIKGNYDEEILNEVFMMHTSTSPFYPIVASCEVSAAMMKGKLGYHVINDAINEAIDFREEIIKLKNQSNNWFYDIWQPENISHKECWKLDNDATWHGFKNVDDDYLYLDPLKVTVLLPGIKNNKLTEHGIPANIAAAFLEDHGIIVEKTGPYSMLFLFSLGITNAKAKKLLAVLNKFKQMYDENLPVKKVLPTIYNEHPDFYKNKTIQEISNIQHQLILKHDLPNTMYHAFDKLPEFVINPHQAYQHLLKKKTKKICIDNLLNETSAVMILPYPPGIPIIMPGEKITKDSKVILDFLLMLEDIGKQLPGFESEIHGLEKGEDDRLYVKVLI